MRKSKKVKKRISGYTSRTVLSLYWDEDIITVSLWIHGNFVCRIELNSKTEEIRVLPFKIVLGGDSRKSRVEINDEQEAFYKELEDSIDYEAEKRVI